MKILPFFILLILFASCALKKNNHKKEIAAVSDSIIPAMDTAIFTPPLYDHYADSINIKHKRDSFYAIKPSYLFTSTGKIGGFNKLIAAAIDTSAVMSSKVSFTSSESYTYNKDRMPVTKTAIYVSRNYKIKIITKGLEDEEQKQLFINGNRLIWGKDIDIFFAGNYISTDIELSPEEFRIVTFKGKEFLYLRGYIEKCNGNGCGVSYHLLYDPELKKAIALQQYRIGELYMGKLGSSNQLGFLVFAEFDQNYLYQCFTVAAKAYLFSINAKIVPAKNATGNQYYFDGYIIDNPDSIRILKAIFPLTPKEILH